ncbi:MAG: histidine triad nucleotide-binding protein [Thermoflexales bacterium]|nr:histidine triad nucleotide-binding protein [Thermoflexales bacterium]
MSKCLFCDIAAGRAPARIVYQDEHITAFHDLHPQAPVHILIVPNRHIVSCAELAAGDEAVMGHLLVKAAHIAAQAGLSGGFRLVSNAGRPAGQSVFHLHVHLLGGRTFRWPPG